MKKNPGRKERRRLARYNRKQEGKARARANEKADKQKSKAKRENKTA